jgi:hypothetical protein
MCFAVDFLVCKTVLSLEFDHREGAEHKGGAACRPDRDIDEIDRLLRTDDALGRGDVLGLERPDEEFEAGHEAGSRLVRRITN